MVQITGMWGINPQIGDNCKLAEDCRIIGDVLFGEGCEIGSKTTISGTNGKIIIENRVKIVHETKILCTLGYATVIEDDVEINSLVNIESSIIIRNSFIGENLF